MKIDMRGVIVPSYYDSDWTQEYIDKGLMIPESTFRRNLANASKDEPLQVYVNSPGGSVFAAYEMINAVREWKAETGQKAEIIIGAMAASAASAFAVMAGSSAKAHKNAKMMFHGASTEAWGGKEALEDEAELLGKINADIQNTLLQKYDLNPETVVEWFKEGRQGWLNADEMLEAGIVSEIIADDADPVVFDEAAMSAIEENGLKIAAVLEITAESETGETATEDGKDGSDEPTEPSESDATEAEAEDVDPEDAGSDTTEDVEDEPAEDDKPTEPSEEYKRGLEDGMAQGRADVALEYQDRINTFNHDLKVARDDSRKYQADRDRLTEKVKQVESESESRATALREKLDEATARIKKHIDGALSFESEPKTWEQAVKDCGGYAQAKAKYPELCSKFKTENGGK